MAVGKPEELVKIVTDSKTNELLGARLVGAEATELIQTRVEVFSFGSI